MAAVGVPATVTASRLEQKLQKAPIGRTNYLETVKEILSRLSLNDHLWIAPNNRTDADDFLHRPDIEDAATWVNKHAWRELWSALTRKERGELNKYWIPETLTHIANFSQVSLPERMLIPAKRELGPKDEAFDDLTGKGLINHLAELQNPDHHERERRKTFDHINEFIRE
ncbi:hypothetical protein LZ189_24380, partial [Rhodovulum sulfidophilum]|nr:hypothetical protein [Rhodovulum sulfidophilum]